MTAASPPPPTQPHPLGPAHRLALLGARAAAATLAPIQRRRGSRAAHGALESCRYGTRRDEALTILSPPRGVAPRTPVVYVHGGGWVAGTRDLYDADLGFLTARGHRVYNVDYPLAPEHPFPIALRSLLAALRFVGSREEEGTEVHLIGDSAGGNLVMMLGFVCADPASARAVGAVPSERGQPRIRSVVSLYGVLDRLSWIEQGFPGARMMLQSYGGRAAFEPEVGPELALTPMDLRVVQRPPCLLATGSADRLAESTRLAAARLARDPQRVELIEYPGERHGFFNARWRPASRQLRADIVRFLDSV